MGGPGGARRVTTPDDLESPVQAAPTGDKTGESRSVIRLDRTERPGGRGLTVNCKVKIASGAAASTAAWTSTPVLSLPLRSGRRRVGSAQPAIPARSSLRNSANSGKRRGSRQRRREGS